jgi:hypothetical protein
MRWSIAAALAVLVAVGAVRLHANAAPQAQQTGIKTVASVMDIMETMTIPFSNVVFSAGAEPPKDDKGWATVRSQAIALAEAGNLLMIGTRVNDPGDWMKMSRAQVDAAEAAATAAAAKNGDALSAAADTLYETCAVCHKAYLKQ